MAEDTFSNITTRNPETSSTFRYRMLFVFEDNTLSKTPANPNLTRHEFYEASIASR